MIIDKNTTRKKKHFNINNNSIYFFRYLNNNKIRSLKSATFDVNKKLNRLRLESNIIECDCSIQWLWKLLKTKHFVEAIVVCSEPNALYGTRLQEVNENEFGCDPKLPANIAGTFLIN